MENNEDTKIVETVEKETTQKTYTVDDINNSFNAGLKKGRAEIEKYHDMEKTNQSNTDKINNLQNENATYKSENEKLKATINELKISNSGVKDEFKKFVASEVNGMITGDIDFDKALETYKNENPHFFKDKQVKKVQSSPILSNGGPKPQTTNDIMNNLLRGK